MLRRPVPSLEEVLAEAGAAVDELASGVEVSEVPGGLLNHVEHDQAEVCHMFVAAAVAPTGWRRQRRRRDNGTGSGDLVAVNANTVSVERFVPSGSGHGSGFAAPS